MSRLRTLVLLPACAVVIAICPPQLVAQGCAQCRDNTAATPPQTQRAYRQAILLLGGVAFSLCAGVLTIGKKFR